jgi:hypothetical protein
MPVGMQVVGTRRIGLPHMIMWWTSCVSEICVCGCGMRNAGVWRTVDLTRDEHALYTSKPVMGYSPYEGIREQEGTDSTAHMRCRRHKLEGPSSLRLC